MGPQLDLYVERVNGADGWRVLVTVRKKKGTGYTEDMLIQCKLKKKQFFNKLSVFKVLQYSAAFRKDSQNTDVSVQ